MCPLIGSKPFTITRWKQRKFIRAFISLKKNIENVFPMFPYSYVNTLVKVWENSKLQRKHSPVARVSTTFLCLPNFTRVKKKVQIK